MFSPLMKNSGLIGHLTFGLRALAGPIEMDVDNDQNNVLVNETVWVRLVQWYG